LNFRAFAFFSKNARKFKSKQGMTNEVPRAKPFNRLNAGWLVLRSVISWVMVPYGFLLTKIRD
jgi:hypothetical protein